MGSNTATSYFLYETTYAVNPFILNGVFDKLAAQITRVASITKGTCGNPVTYWQNRNHHGSANTFDSTSFLYRPKLLGSQ
jgi:hypothetical protein